ncbi:hypothetical protein ANN_11963 [Periplaneta americana]|uniref:Uncharacterized protein n=1 Tax=Periplaneta americana TaxID=6978 RepID=A0ABQ8T8D7_PERAM|nr:hypothetical protein ANN_11963 [Periplaneta americana]
MAGLCEGDNEPPGSLKAFRKQDPKLLTTASCLKYHYIWMASTNSELPPSAASRVAFEGCTTAPYRGMHAIARFTSVGIVPPIVPCLIVAGGCNEEGCKAPVLTEMKIAVASFLG